MWIVRLALNRPYTFVVLALLILIISPLVILRTPTDIFPNIDIPVVAVVWNYTGLSPEEKDVLLHHGTEAPFCGGLLGHTEQGVYGCRLCGLPLFRSVAKFESGTHWPSFY